jgi:hypothetical protein
MQNENNKKSLEGMCESCLMPFKKDPKGAGRESEKYCSYCFHDGKLAYEGNDLKEFKKAMVDAIVARGESRIMAHIYAFMSGFAPRWKGQNNFFGKIFGSYGRKCAENDLATKK